MFEKKRRAPDPLAAELEEIDSVWGEGGWFLANYEIVLHDNLDVAYHATLRQQARTIAAARKAELVADLRARRQR